MSIRISSGCIIQEWQAVMVPLVRLHQVDDTPYPAIKKALELECHQILLPVPGIIARQETSGGDPVAPIKKGFCRGSSVNSACPPRG